MRILVTGATGFLGGAVSRRLHGAGHQVLTTGRDRGRGQKLEAAGLRFAPAELCDVSAVHALCEQQDAVVHCAALSSPWGAREAFVNANIRATEVLVGAARIAGVRRFVHISTPSIYMGDGDRELVAEDDPLPAPINAYAATKREAESIVRGAHAAGLPSLILRPRAIFGPDDTTIFPRLIKALEGGLLPVLGDGRNRVDLTYVDNVALAVELSLNAGEAVLGQAYNITNGEPVLLWDVIGKLCAALQLAPPRRRLPRPVALALGSALEHFHLVFRSDVEPHLTRYTVEVMSRTMTLDIRRAQRLLGYAPCVSMDEGIARFIAWWKANPCPV